MDELLRLDPTFSLPNFITKVDNIYVMLCTSVMTNNLKRVSHFLSDEVYKKYEDKINELNKKNVIQMYDELNVKSTEVIDVKITEEEYIITVRLVSRYMDYLINKDTREFVRGNNSRRIEVENTLVFTKKVGAKKLSAARSCPSCGANMDLNKTGVCPFCGNVFEQDDHDFILTDIN